MKLTLLISALLTLSSAAHADKYALVIGGASDVLNTQHQEGPVLPSTSQEFARTTAATTMGLAAKGYQTILLFGSGQADPETQKYPEDYAKIASLAGPQTTLNTATPAAIDDSFQALIAKAKAGDQIQIVVNAHGGQKCLDPNFQALASDAGAPCEHQFVVFGAPGDKAVVTYPSNKLVKYMQQLEAKGVQTTLVIGSCNSGRAKDAVKKARLKEGCIFFASAGNEVGNSCFEDDPDWVKDYTSTNEYISLHFYQDILPELEKDPYFAKSNCFKKVVQYATEKKMDLTSLTSAFWSARANDQTFQSPALSSLMRFPYFMTGNLETLQLKDSQGEILSCKDITQDTTKLIYALEALGEQISNAITAPYYQAATDYNEAAVAYTAAKNQHLPAADADLNALQQTVRAKAQAFIAQERGLIDQLFKALPQTADDPCARPL